jgi:hypothetical protein
MVEEPAESTPSGPSRQRAGDEERALADERERASAGADPGERESASEQAGSGERVGPLVLTRYVKDDGRALILYARGQDERA